MYHYKKYLQKVYMHINGLRVHGKSYLRNEDIPMYELVSFYLVNNLLEIGRLVGCELDFTSSYTCLCSASPGTLP